MAFEFVNNVPIHEPNNQNIHHWEDNQLAIHFHIHRPPSLHVVP